MLFDFFFPSSYSRMYLQVAGTFLLMAVIFFWSAYNIGQQLSPNIISGKVVDVKVGTVGGASSRFPGRSTVYHIQLQGYARNFMLSDAGIFEDWQLNPNDIKVGNTVSFKIKTEDVSQLQKPTAYKKAGQFQVLWPQDESSIKIYGIIINGKTFLSPGSSVRNQAYQRWFWVMVPLFIYAVFCVFVRTQFRYWTPAAERRMLDKLDKPKPVN